MNPALPGNSSRHGHDIAFNEMDKKEDRMPHNIHILGEIKNFL
jgi:hypothetical protein